MKLYHRTTAASAEAILRDGFKDGTGHYLTDRLHSSVWLSNVPLDCNEGAWGDVLLEVTLDVTEDDLGFYEWTEEGKPYREWLTCRARFLPGPSWVPMGMTLRGDQST